MKNYAILALIVLSIHALDLNSGEIEVVPHEFALGSDMALVVQKPTDWVSHISGSKDVTAFRISKEKNEDGSFLTGLTVNIVTDVKAKSQLAPSDYSKKYLADVYRGAGESALEFFPESKENDLFMKIGIRVDEQKVVAGKDYVFTVNHNVFYNDKLDIMLISIFGTPKEQWAENEKYFMATIKMQIVKKDIPNESLKPSP